jgi:hypothetical protein
LFHSSANKGIGNYRKYRNALKYGKQYILGIIDTNQSQQLHLKAKRQQKLFEATLDPSII